MNLTVYLYMWDKQYNPSHACLATMVLGQSSPSTIHCKSSIGNLTRNLFWYSGVMNLKHPCVFFFQPYEVLTLCVVFLLCTEGLDVNWVAWQLIRCTLSDWLIDWFDWLIDWLIDWLVGWLIDWLIDCLSVCLSVLSLTSLMDHLWPSKCGPSLTSSISLYSGSPVCGVL